MKTWAFVPRGPQSPCRCTISPPSVPSFCPLSATRSDFQFLQHRGLMLASGPLDTLSLLLECSFLTCFLSLSLDVVRALRSFCRPTSSWLSWAEDRSLGVCRWGWSQTWRGPGGGGGGWRCEERTWARALRSRQLGGPSGEERVIKEQQNVEAKVVFFPLAAPHRDQTHTPHSEGAEP